jgi:uncharacterized protein YukE
MAATTTLPTKRLQPLAPFSYDWVGGNINGLAALAGTLYGYIPQFEDVITALDSKVSQIAGDAGWRGAAAEAFTGNWEQISAQTTAIGLVIVQAGSIVDELAVNLSEIENALECAAEETMVHGVAIESDGQPTPQCYANQTVEDWRVDYSFFYQQCKAAAENARVHAAGSLQNLFDAMTSRGPVRSGGKRASSDPEGLGTKLGEGTTIADLLLDLIATKTAYSNTVAKEVDALASERALAVKALRTAQAAAREANGRFGKPPADVKENLRDVEAKLNAEKSALAEAEENENALSKIFGTRLRDLPGLKGSSAIEGLDDGSVLDGAFDLPVVDVVAGGIATVINAQEDEKQGIPGYVAYPAEAGASTAAITAGTMAGAVVAGVVDLPVLGVAAGIAACAVVAYGVGDYLHNLIETYGNQQLAIAQTDGDIRQMGKDIGHLAQRAWGKIESQLGF